MTQVVLFHSALGLRPGVRDAAELLRAAGHDVLVVDQYDGRVFDNYADANAYVETIGFPALMQRAVEAVKLLPDGFVVAGFSNGGGMAEYVATQRSVSGVLMLSGALPLAFLGVDVWPANVPAQIHYTANDPFRPQEWIDAVAASVHAAGGRLETFDYPGGGHLFTDASLPDEYQPQEAQLLWERVLAFTPLAAPAKREPLQDLPQLSGL